MWRSLLLVFAVLLVGCSSGMLPGKNEAQGLQKPADHPPAGTAQPGIVPTLANLGQAPELTNEVWLNSDVPLRLADLRGKVVLLEMWTFG